MIASYSINYDVPLRILLADSNMAAQAMGTKILAAAGHEVIAVSNGVRVVKRIAEFRPNLVLLDVYLAGLGGVEICHKLKATPEMAHIPVLLTVGKMEPFRAEQSIEAKADGLIIKPFQASYLIPVVAKLAELMHPPEPLNQPSPGALEPAQIGRPAVHNLVMQSSGQSAAERCQPGRELGSTWPSSSPRQDREICDVCGCVNLGNATICQECDVPLPSSVMAFRRAHHA